MGSSGSKSNAAALSSSSSSPAQSPSPSSSSVVRRTRTYRSRVFRSSCLRSRENSGNGLPQLSKGQSEGNAVHGRCTNETKPASDAENSEYCSKVKIAQSEEIVRATSKLETDEWGRMRGGCMSSRAFSSRALNPSSHFLSRLSFFPGNGSFRLCRANSLGSARPFTSSTGFAMSNNAGDPSPSGSTINEHNGARNRDLFAACFSNHSPISEHDDLAIDNLQQMTSSPGVLSNRIDAGVDCDGNPGLAHHAYNDGVGPRLTNRRITAGETVEQNVQFSRTLSVGRLRDRVLRRTPFPDLACNSFQQDRGVRHASRGSERELLGGPVSSEENASLASSRLAGPGSSVYRSQDYEAQASRPRGTRYHDLLEYRSNFLERRRRIRSQVCALQRLGSRFENFSGHERTCILSGQHRRGHCTCQSNIPEADTNNETSARASISRIVMLAEALFEVLDEIHQQSVVLSSRPSMSSIGSVPAPNEVVESLPLRSYNKVQKHLYDETAQCYICLLEYEEGDSVRILPCQHEYHKTCIDKWLKEIHRVCPLCRGDVCKSDSSPVDV